MMLYTHALSLVFTDQASNGILHGVSFQGSPQWISVELESPTEVCEIDMQFQGGFVGRDCSLEGRLEPGTDWVKLQDFYPQDKNGVQVSFLPSIEGFILF
ncbi:hypothetical protein DPMN_159678 [Dreissena polymorpha]|uniref:Uncharacterized protein n=1 Tax=Dreissena polymorpha TaxID=45954 RepID=A0A9D4IQX2_DREPO|nr:hypothetical protein DPMN_159678 [Dreissena polymorpha]